MLEASARGARYFFAFNQGEDRAIWKQARFNEVLPRGRIRDGKAYAKAIEGNRNTCVEAGSVPPEPTADFTLYDSHDLSVSDLFRIRGIDSALLDLEIDGRYFTGFASDHPEWEEDGNIGKSAEWVKVGDIYGGKAENFQHVPVAEEHLHRLRLTHSQLLKAGARRKP